MMKRKWINVISGIATAIFSIIVAILVLQVSMSELNIPYAYNTDALDVLVEARSAIQGDDIWTVDGVAAPYGKTLYNVRQGSWLDIAIIRRLAQVIGDVGISINVYYLLSFAMISVACYVVLRCIKVSNVIAISCGIIYACMPFHFIIGEYMLSLSAYYMVPFACLIVYWVLKGDIYSVSVRPKLWIYDRNKFIASLIIIGVLALNNIYYAAFFAMLLFFSIIYISAEKRAWKRFFLSLSLEIVLGVILMVNYVPAFIYNNIYNENVGNFQGRTLFDLDEYGLKLSVLFLPIQGHRIDFFQTIRDTYNAGVDLNENSAASLGLVMACGVIFSIFKVFFSQSNSEYSVTVKTLGKMNLFTILLGVSGGLNVFVGLFFTCSIRCYSRLSVYIGMFGIIVVAYTLDYFKQRYLETKVKNKMCKNMIVCLAIFCLTVFAVLDQTTTLYANILFPDWNDYTKYYATREEAIEEYNSDNQFVQKIEYEMEEGDMIFQLPIIAGTTLQNFPNGVPNGYDLLKPYIHSTKLRWSFGDKVGGKTDQWLTQIQSQSIDLLLQEIGIKGFKGLYIDSRGYSKNVFTDIINYLEEETGVIPLIDTKKGIYFYNLSSYFEEKSYTNTHDENVVDLNSIYTRYNIDGKTVENIKTGEIVNFYVFINHKGEYSLKLRTEGNVMPEVRLCYEYNGTKISLTAQKQEEGMYTFIVPVRDGELCVELANNSDSDVNIYREEIIYVQDIQD